MHIEELLWLGEVIDKLAHKHAVLPGEVNEVFNSDPVFAIFRRGVA
jgi:hypothetical protein